MESRVVDRSALRASFRRHLGLGAGTSFGGGTGRDDDDALGRAERAYAWTCENVLLEAWERFIRRRPTMDYLAWLRHTQWLPREQIEAIQLERLKRLLVHAGEHVPYYRELFRAIGFDPRAITSRRDMAAIPPLTKDIVRARYHDLVDPAHRGRNLKKGTSGSTGQPFKFEYSLDSEAWRQAVKIRGYEWGGYRIGLTTFHYWAQVYGPAVGAKGAKLWLDRRIKRDVFVDSMKQDDASRLAAVDLLRRTKPRTIVCYTQSCAQLARFIVERGLRDWDDIPVLCGAEAVLPGDRAAIAQAFGPHVFETYGSRETMLMASECSAHDGMHLSEENLLVEVARGQEPLGPGEPGEVLVTDLNNYGMPFIRYANGDVATLAPEQPCPCGRGLRKLQRVEGRRADTLRDAEGRPIPGIVFHVLFSDARQDVIQQFQAVQRASGDVVLKIVRGPDYTEEAFAEKVARFSEYLGGLPMTIEMCSDIPPMPNGKRKTIIVEPAGAASTMAPAPASAPEPAAPLSA
jgi:phenylacetate-CoA ligase